MRLLGFLLFGVVLLVCCFLLFTLFVFGFLALLFFCGQLLGLRLLPVFLLGHLLPLGIHLLGCFLFRVALLVALLFLCPFFASNLFSTIFFSGLLLACRLFDLALLVFPFLVVLLVCC